MGLVANEIIQSRTYIDPNAPAPPNLNYKHTFPITVFDAVRASMSDPDSTTLSEALDRIDKRLLGVQPLIPDKAANNLVTYAGYPGGVGSIEIGNSIPWNKDEQRHDRIPTEKAVGDLMYKLGLINEDGKPAPPGTRLTNWNEIIGRPKAYTSLGENDDGFVTQKSITEEINNMGRQMISNNDDNIKRVSDVIAMINAHIANKDNPHEVDLSSIGAASQRDLDYHVNSINPHRITKDTIGLGKVNNTSDLEKPISNATKEALKEIITRLDGIDHDISSDLSVSDARYDANTGSIEITYSDGSEIRMDLPFERLVDDVRYDKESKELVIINYGNTFPRDTVDTTGNSEKDDTIGNGTHIDRIDLSDLFIRYLGSSSTNINVVIDGNQRTGEQTIKANIKYHSITSDDIADYAISERNIKAGSVTNAKIRDLSITTKKLADGTITNEKIADGVIGNIKLADRAVNGRTLFSSQIDDRVLITGMADTDPYWGRINGYMIMDESISEDHLMSESISDTKIKDMAVTTGKISDDAITSSKLAANSVTNEKIVNGAVDGDKIEKSVMLLGSPSISVTPPQDSNDNTLPNTKWVKDTITSALKDSNKFGARSVDGSMLFSSPYQDRVLIVSRANKDPEWGTINGEMIESDSIGTSHIKDDSITPSKIRECSIFENHLNRNIVGTDHIKDGSISSEKLFTSNMKDMVLASLTEGGHPTYSKVTRQMIEHNAIGSWQIEDKSITNEKLFPSSIDNVVLVTSLRNTTPSWQKITARMIEDKSITPDKLSTTAKQNSILAVTVPNEKPIWTKINSEMLGEDIVKREHIGKKEIWQEHLREKIIDHRYIADKTITNDNIASRTITGAEMFSSDNVDRVLAVSKTPYSDPKWMQITTPMIEDGAVTPEKLFRSKVANMVLGVDVYNGLPKYTRITNDFIQDGTISGSKFSADMIFRGTPSLEYEPSKDADNYQLANTGWVRKTISEVISGSHLTPIPGTAEIDDFSLSYDKLVKSDKAGVLSSTKSGDPLSLNLVDSDLIKNAAVTSDKIAHDVVLWGSPSVEVRPSSIASDSNGSGTLIPDCQWVLDRIRELVPTESKVMHEMKPDTVQYSWEYGYEEYIEPGENEITKSRVVAEWESEEVGDLTPDENEISDATVQKEWDNNGEGDTMPDDDDATSDPFGNTDDPPTGTGSALTPGSVTNEMLGTRAVQGKNLFSSDQDNQVLLVKNANTDPVYGKITGNMVENQSIGIDKINIPNDQTNSVMGAGADGVVKMTKVSGAMIEDGAISNSHLKANSITSDKIAPYSIDHTKIVKEAFVTEPMIMDSSVSERKIKDSAVTTDKILDQAITTDKIEDGAVTPEKLSSGFKLPDDTTVNPSTSYEARQLRNMIISVNAPTNSSNGDVWFKYA